MSRIPLALLIAATWLWPALASAHQASVTYSTVELGADGSVSWSLRINTRDLYEALGLERDRDATDAEVRAGEARLHDYIARRVKVQADGRACPPGDFSLAMIEQTQRFAAVHFSAACPVPLRTVTLTYDLFFDLDPRHTGMLAITHGEKTVNAEMTRGLARFDWDLDLQPPPSLGPLDYVWKGMEHIYTGYDHIAFVVGLVLVAVMQRRSARAILQIVTAFTVAHSITLILAALDVISLPSRLVESAIAASIVYIAVENIVVREPRARWPLAFVFGLIHGLGFAAMLRPLLPPHDVIVPLLLFNVGVELGQLSIVVPLGILLALACRADPARYRRSAVFVGSGLVALLGLIWLVERVADVNIISTYMG